MVVTRIMGNELLAGTNVSSQPRFAGIHCVLVRRCRRLSVFVGGCGVVRLGVGCCRRRGRVLCFVSPDATLVVLMLLLSSDATLVI